MFIFDVFTQINGYPRYVVTSILKKFEDKHTNSETASKNNVSIPVEVEEEKNPTLFLKVPFRGKEAEALLKSLNSTLKRTLPTKEFRIVNTGSKLSNYFSLEDPLDKKHQSGFIYKHDCRNKRCSEDYVGETGRRSEFRFKDHAGKDKNSHIYQHSSKMRHPKAKAENFEILGVNYPDRRKRKLAEAMFIRDLKPTLNKQKDSYKLSLFR